MDDQEYTKGFNQGYVFKQHKPLLYETVAEGLIDDTPYRQGFHDGGKQYQMDNIQQQLKNRKEAQRDRGRGSRK